MKRSLDEKDEELEGIMDAYEEREKVSKEKMKEL